jgi:Zn-dependent protease
MEFLIQIVIFLPSIIIALTVHEFSHAWVAYKLGDPTAKAEGRLTFNPLAHLDPLGTIMLILFRFGWGKPVPINKYNFKNPVVGTALSSIAGPASNLLLALLTTAIFHIFTPTNIFLNAFLLYFILINIVLMIFNLLPIPPLDGHKIVRALLPRTLRYSWESLETYSPYILIFTLFIIIYTGALSKIMYAILEFLIPQYYLYL